MIHLKSPPSNKKKRSPRIIFDVEIEKKNGLKLTAAQKVHQPFLFSFLLFDFIFCFFVFVFCFLIFVFAFYFLILRFVFQCFLFLPFDFFLFLLFDFIVALN